MEDQTYISLMKQGKVEGFNEIPEFIETTVSNVFIFPQAKKVLKICRRDNEYWNKRFSDLSKNDTRIQFVKEDFNANHAVNPLVYLELKKIDVNNGIVKLNKPNGEDYDLVILMNYVDAKQSFNDKLFQKKIHAGVFESIGSQFADLKKNLLVSETKTNANWLEIMTQNVSDVKGWMESLSQYIQPEIIDRYAKLLTKYIEFYAERFSSVKSNDLAYSIDAHGENALYNEGKLEFIDILFPSVNWRWAPKEYDLYRLGTDIYMLSGKENFENYINGVKKEYTSFDKKDKDFYLLHSAALMLCILATLLQSKPEKEPLMKKYYQGFIKQLESFSKVPAAI